MNPAKLICGTFLVLGALFGSGFALIVPPLQTPDEFAHFYRAYSVSEGHCIPQPSTPIPRTIEVMADSFQPHLETQRRIGFEDIWAYMRVALRPDDQDGVRNEAINVYNCIPYTPAAVGVTIGRIFSAPPLAILYLARFANLAAFLAVVYLALRQLPDFQMPLICIALMPMTLNQAASASWDAVSFSTAFFLCTYIVKLAWDDSIPKLETRHYAVLGIAILIAALSKTNIWLAPLAVFIPSSKFRTPREKWLVLLGYCFLAAMAVGGWNYINRENTAKWVENIARQKIIVSDNLAVVYQHPVLFLGAVGRTCAARWTNFASEFIGKFGWLVVDLPVWAVAAYLGLIGLVTLTGTSHIRIMMWQRLVCLDIFALAAGSMFVALWCANTPEEYRNFVLHGVGHVPGVQGRYFIPFALPLLLAFSNRVLRVQSKWLLAAAAVVVITVNATALEAIHDRFYVSERDVIDYNNRLVRIVGPTAEDAKVFLIRDGKRHWVMHGTWFAKHGYRWPEDVHIIPAVQLAAYPQGEPITEE